MVSVLALTSVFLSVLFILIYFFFMNSWSQRGWNQQTKLKKEMRTARMIWTFHFIAGPRKISGIQRKWIRNSKTRKQNAEWESREIIFTAENDFTEKKIAKHGRIKTENENSSKVLITASSHSRPTPNKKKWNQRNQPKQKKKKGIFTEEPHQVHEKNRRNKNASSSYREYDSFAFQIFHPSTKNLKNGKHRILKSLSPKIFNPFYFLFHFSKQSQMQSKNSLAFISLLFFYSPRSPKSTLFTNKK